MKRVKFVGLDVHAETIAVAKEAAWVVVEGYTETRILESSMR